MATPHYRTLLDRLVREGRRTIEETCEAYEKAAQHMGERAALSPRQLARWMAGDVGHPRPVAQRVAERFWGYGFDALLGPADALPNGRTERFAEGRSTPAIPRPLPSITGGAVAAPRDLPEGSFESDAGSGAKQIGWLAESDLDGGVTSAFAQAAAEVGEFTRRAEATDVGPQTLEHLDLAVAGMASAFAHTPPDQMFVTARTYRQRVAWLIEGRQTLRQRRELYRYAGWLSIILGWLCHDLGDPVAARAHCLDAWEHGWQAEDMQLCAWSMDTAATVAMYHDEPDRARDAATRGLACAAPDSAAAVRLSCQLTRAYGRLGQPDRFDDALVDTRRQFDQLNSLGSGLFSADAGRIASYAATSSIWLDRPVDAARYAEQALCFYVTVDPGNEGPRDQYLEGR